MPNFRNLVLHQPLTNSQLRVSSLTTRGITVAHLVDAVFEGGGALGAAYTGSLLALERQTSGSPGSPEIPPEPSPPR